MRRVRILTCGRNKDCGASAKLASSDKVDSTREPRQNTLRLYLVQIITFFRASETTLLLSGHVTNIRHYASNSL